MDNEPDDLIMISALEHWSYCPRQCGLIHVDQTYEENLYTMRGQAMHKIVDEVETEVQHGVRIERALPLWSKRLGLVGKADVVEFHGETPYPVEYKSGPRRQWEHDDVQLCAQALCLEEMTGQSVPRGAIYHHKSRRRREVVFDESLREYVAQVVVSIRTMLNAKTLPPPVNDQRCDKCSLKESCMPGVIDQHAMESRLLAKLFDVSDSEG